MSGNPGWGAGSTWIVAVPETPLLAAAVITASPGDTPVATPAALTVATAGALVVQASATLAIGCCAASNAAPVNAWVLPTSTVALAGDTVTLATTGGGGVASLS